MKESEIQREIKEALQMHPRVAWCKVNTTGTFKGMTGGRPIKIGLIGESDIIGQLKGTGRFFAIEVKVPGELPTQKQMDFLAMVADHNGVSGWATSITEAEQIINDATQKIVKV